MDHVASAFTCVPLCVLPLLLLARCPDALSLPSYKKLLISRSVSQPPSFHPSIRIVPLSSRLFHWEHLSRNRFIVSLYDNAAFPGIRSLSLQHD